MKAGNSHLDFGGEWHLQPIRSKVLSKPKDVVPQSGMYLLTELPKLQSETTLGMLGIISIIFTNKVCACHGVNWLEHAQIDTNTLQPLIANLILQERDTVKGNR